MIRGNWTGSAVAALALLAGACTYGPEARRSSVGQIVGVVDSYEAFVTVTHERFRPPTGLSAFPDGGKARVLERRVRLYRVDAEGPSVTLLTDLAAPDSLWESFRVSLRGIRTDGTAFLAAIGCPRGGECYPTLWKTMTLRVDRRGAVTPVDSVPEDANLPGAMGERRPGETRYVRFRTEGPVIEARFEPDGPYVPLFEISDDGTLGLREGPAG